MNVQNKYKVLSFATLGAVIVFSFFLANFVLNQIINDNTSAWSIIYVIVALVLNFSMFFIVFRLIQLLTEREATISELTRHLSIFRDDKKSTEVSEEKSEKNIDELVEQAIPASPQTLGLNKFCEKLLANIGKVAELSHGLMYIKDKSSGEFRVVAKYAYYTHFEPPVFFEGETLPGQVAKDKKILNISEIPGDYFIVNSGLGAAKPSFLILVPVIEKEETIALMELAAFKAFDKDDEAFLGKLSVMSGKIILKLK